MADPYEWSQLASQVTYTGLDNNTADSTWALSSGSTMYFSPSPAQQQYYVYYNDMNKWTTIWEYPKPEPIDPELWLDEGI